MDNKPSKYHIHSVVGMAQYEGLKALGFYEAPYINAAIALHKDSYYLSPDVDSGLMSVQAHDNAVLGKSNLNTHDHYRSRTKSSRDFFNHFNQDRFNIDKLERATSWYKSRCRTHTITREENTALIKYQNDLNLKDKHYTFHYEAVGITELVPKPDLKNKFVYIISGEAYNSAKDVAAEFDITTSTVHSRCKNERFNEWKKIPKKNQLKS